ncbi:PepSY-associated TM helix domain-containing protein [Oleisolibacter albus]|uniref:PepSY-associated TM helix domain-containing protein n=1 Tax=Oleisolibacter albus TaxID=2171757 RepID=UPI000DF29C02|nr:PepSY domain-containing protein [Oleisolibacter albus]
MVSARPLSRGAATSGRSSQRVWWLVHKWTSLICTLFMLLLCVTGLPLIFHEEIEAAFHLPPLRTVAPGTPAPPIDSIVAAALAKRPDEIVQFVFFDQALPIVSVATAPAVETPFDQAHIQPFDRRTGEAITLPAPDGGFLHWMEEAHIRLFLGLPGTLFLGAMGVVFLAALVSGIVLYAPFMRKLPFGAVRKHRSPRVTWLDLHNMLGIVTATWLLAVGATGVFNTLDVPIAGYWQATGLAEMTAAYKGDAAAPADRASLDAAIAAAAAVSPGMQPYSIAYPGNPFSSPHHYAIFMAGKDALTRYILRPTLVDARTGVLTVAKDMPPLVQALFISRPLHFGNYGGLPLKLIWALLDLAAIMVLVSGLYLWWTRRRGPSGPHGTTGSTP